MKSTPGTCPHCKKHFLSITELKNHVRAAHEFKEHPSVIPSTDDLSGGRFINRSKPNVGSADQQERESKLPEPEGFDDYE